MHILQILGRFLGNAIMRTSLILLPLCIASSWLLGNTAYIKKTLAESGLYKTVVPAILDESVTATEDTEGKMLLQDPGVRSAVESAFTPNSIQQSTETVLDAYHAWLTGKTSSLQFSVDVQPNIDALRKNVASYAQARAESLPVCTLAQLKELPAEQTILTAPCVPPGSSPAAIGQDFSNKVIAQADFLQKSTLTEQDLPKDQNSAAQSTPRESTEYFRLFTQGQWIVGIAGLIAGSAYVLLSTDRRQAFKSIAKTAIGIGALFLIGCGIYMLINAQVEKSLVAHNNPAFQSAVITLFRELGSDFNRIIATVSALYIGAGTATLIIIRRLAPPSDPPVYQVTGHNTQTPQGGTV